MPGEDDLVPEPSTRVVDTRLPTTRSLRSRPRRPLPALPERIGRFRPLEVLGRGGMGVVYRAEDPELGRIVALKLLTSPREDLDAQQRLRREAQALAQLSHPHVVQVFAVGVLHGQVYVAMELVAGCSLRVWVRQQPRSVEAIVEAYIQAGEGLDAAHARGIIHRDFKPDNAIMGDDGRVRVLDFGLACADSTRGKAPVDTDAPTAPFPSMLDAPLTASGAVMGTPVYMASEIHQGKPATTHSDQFALCVSLYEALHGHRPFEATRLSELVGRILRGELSSEPLAPGVPPRLHAVILRGLRPEPEQRWPSLDALLAELRGATRPAARGRRGIVALASTLALCVGVVGLAMPNDDTPCATPHAKLGGIWDDARRIEVRGNLLRSPATYAVATWERVESGLDDYAERLVEVHREVCGPTRDDGTLDLRMTCLERRREALRALVDVLADPARDVLVRAPSLVAGLDDVDACVHGPADAVTRLPAPRDAAQAAEVAAVRAQLARSTALIDAGTYEAAAREASEAWEQAQAIDYPPLLAEAAFRQGVALLKRGDPAAAQPLLERAYFIAVSIGYDEIVGSVAVWLVHGSGVGKGDLAAAVRWAEHGLAATEGRDERTRASVLYALGNVYLEQGDEERALELFEQALAIQERVLDPLDARIASTLNRVGMMLAELDQPSRALVVQERAFAIWEQTAGPDHPNLAQAHHYRSLAFEALEQYDRALADNRRALAIWERTLGPDHPEVGIALANLGVLLRAMDRTPEAIDYYRRALAVFEAAVGPEHPRVASMHYNLGLALDDIGDRAGAINELRLALALREQVLGVDHPTTVTAREALQERLVPTNEAPAEGEVEEE